MRSWIPPVGGLCLLLLVACSSLEVTRPPAREPDLYPDAEERAALTVAIDVISDPGRVQRYFAAPLLEAGILPVQVMVSNRSEHRVLVRPADVLLLRGRRVIDPLPIESVVEAALDDQVVTNETAEGLRAFFEDLSFRHSVVPSASTYQGILFVPRSSERRDSRFFRIASLFLEPSLWLRLAATDLETRERIHFGPFGLTR